jgi:hypothetical protein
MHLYALFQWVVSLEATPIERVFHFLDELVGLHGKYTNTIYYTIGSVTVERSSSHPMVASTNNHLILTYVGGRATW